MKDRKNVPVKAAQHRLWAIMGSFRGRETLASPLPPNALQGVGFERFTQMVAQ